MKDTSETTTTSIIMPVVIKHALKLVAADKGSSASEILRDLAENVVTTHKGGIFFDIAARKFAHKSGKNAQDPTE